MKSKDFLYWLVNENGEPLSGDLKTGNISTGSKDTLLNSQGVPAFLEKTPSGWMDVLVKFARSPKYWGLFRDYTTPMMFVRDGRLIITDAFRRKGIEAFIKMIILKADRTKWPIKYFSWYSGEIDFSTIKQQRPGTSVNVMEGGLSKLLKANENTEYEIELDDIQVRMDGFFLDCRFNFTGFHTQAGAIHTVPLSFVNSEGTQLSLAHTNEAIVTQNFSPGYETTSDQWFLKCFEDTSIRLVGTQTITPFANDFEYKMLFRTSTGRTQEIINIPLTHSGSYIDYPIDVTFDILAGESVFLEGNWAGSGLTDMTYDNGDYAVYFKNKFKTTYCKVITPFNLFARLVEKITDGKFFAISDLLTQMKGYCFTCGDALRGLEGSVIKISLKDFFQCITARFMGGLGTEKDKLRIEGLGFFFKPEISFDLGVVNELELTVATDLFFNTISAGYKEISYNDVNGRFEFNQGQKYGTPITRIAKELDLQSPVRADAFGIEFARINFDNKTTTDASSDNDTFILNIEDDPTNEGDLTFYKLNRPNFLTITGVPDPVNIFNILLSPKRGLLYNGPLIRSVMDHQDDKFIKFLTGDKNVDLSVSAPIGDPVTENGNTMIGFLGPKLFLPYFFNFKTAVPVNLQDILKSDPYKQIQFTYKGLKYYGYLWDGGVAPASNDVQQWKMLCSTKNDYTSLSMI